MKFNYKVLIKCVAGYKQTHTYTFSRSSDCVLFFLLVFFCRMDGHFRVLQYILDVTHHCFLDIANSGQKNVPTPVEQFLGGHVRAVLKAHIRANVT